MKRKESFKGILTFFYYAFRTRYSQRKEDSLLQQKYFTLSVYFQNPLTPRVDFINAEFKKNFKSILDLFR